MDQERRRRRPVLTSNEARARLRAAASAVEPRRSLRAIGPWTLVGIAAGAGILVGYKPRLALSVARAGGRLLSRAAGRAAKKALEELAAARQA